MSLGCSVIFGPVKIVTVTVFDVVLLPFSSVTTQRYWRPSKSLTRLSVHSAVFAPALTALMKLVPVGVLYCH